MSLTGPYRAIFAKPGAKGFSAAGLLGRMTLSMMGIGVVTMVSQLTGRYGLAGALSATMALSVAAIGPQISRLVDQHGQRRVLRPALLVTLTAVAGLLTSAHLGWPDWTLFAFAACAGCVPSVGSMIRARWAALLRDSPRELHAAYAWESTIDEMCFIVGPIISIGLSTAWFPEAGPLLAVSALTIGVLWLTSLRATEPPPHPRTSHGGGSALSSPVLRMMVLTFVATGAIFGAVDVVTVAFADDQGHKAAASLVLAAYALGSCLAGVVFGLLDPKGPADRRWLLGVCAMGVSMIPLQLVGSLPLLAVALFVAGLTIAPTMVTTMSLIGGHVPAARLTEGMTWVSTGLAVGVAVGSSVAGWVVDAAGARAGYLVAAGAAALAVAVAFLGYRRLRPAPADRGSGGDVRARGQGGAGRRVAELGGERPGPADPDGEPSVGSGAGR